MFPGTIAAWKVCSEDICAHASPGPVAEVGADVHPGEAVKDRVFLFATHLHRFQLQIPSQALRPRRVLMVFHRFTRTRVCAYFCHWSNPSTLSGLK